jgi:hypothetical protein
MNVEWDERKAACSLVKHHGAFTDKLYESGTWNQEPETQHDDDLREEYDETLLKNGVRGKYVQRLASGSNVVRLAPDVAAAFPTEEAVNEALRLLLETARRTVQNMP